MSDHATLHHVPLPSSLSLHHNRLLTKVGGEPHETVRSVTAVSAYSLMSLGQPSSATTVICQATQRIGSVTIARGCTVRVATAIACTHTHTNTHTHTHKHRWTRTHHDSGWGSCAGALCLCPARVEVDVACVSPIMGRHAHGHGDGREQRPCEHNSACRGVDGKCIRL